MLKKAIPLVLMSGFVLTACANNDTVPDNNETPMEKVEDRTKDLTPEVNDGQTGPNMDGLDNNGDSNGVDNGVMDNGTTTTPTDETINNENTTNPNEMIIDEKEKKNENGNMR